MNEIYRDLKLINIASKSIKTINIIRALLTVGIIVFGVLKGKKITEYLIEK